MDNKLKFQQLECYKLATDEQKEKLNKEQYFDLDKLPGNQLQTEFVEYIYYRGTQQYLWHLHRLAARYLCCITAARRWRMSSWS